MKEENSNAVLTIAFPQSGEAPGQADSLLGCYLPTLLPCSKASPALRAFLSSNCMLTVTLWKFYLLS